MLVRVDYFAVEGVWWLPESPEHKMPGSLTFDADGLGLTVDGSLVPTVAAPGQVLAQGPPDWTTTPVILGTTRDGRKVTLLATGGANLVGPKIGRSTYRGGFAVVGAHTRADSFTEAWCEFDCLNAWTHPPSLTEDAEELDRLALRFKNIELGQVQIGDAQIRLVARVVGEAGGDTVNLSQHATFSAEIPAASLHDLLDKWIRPLQDLLIVSLGRPVRLTALFVRPRDADRHDDLAEVSFEAVQPAPGPIPSWATVTSYTAPTLLTFADSPMPFADLLPRWFQLRSDLREVLVLLNGPYYASFMFSEHRYSSTFQSAEALAAALGLSGREKSREDHGERVAAIISAAEAAGVDEEAVDWARRILQTRNDKPLSKQIEDLIASTGEVGRVVLAASPAFGEIAAAARTGVSHGGAQRALGAVGRHWHGEILRWVIRTGILMVVGIDRSEIERRVQQRAGFQQALNEIRADPDNDPIHQ
jgi:hypothetical protein